MPSYNRVTISSGRSGRWTEEEFTGLMIIKQEYRRLTDEQHAVLFHATFPHLKAGGRDYGESHLRDQWLHRHKPGRNKMWTYISRPTGGNSLPYTQSELNEQARVRQLVAAAAVSAASDIAAALVPKSRPQQSTVAQAANPSSQAPAANLKGVKPLTAQKDVSTAKVRESSEDISSGLSIRVKGHDQSNSETKTGTGVEAIVGKIKVGEPTRRLHTVISATSSTSDAAGEKRKLPMNIRTEGNHEPSPSPPKRSRRSQPTEPTRELQPTARKTAFKGRSSVAMYGGTINSTDVQDGSQESLRMIHAGDLDFIQGRAVFNPKCKGTKQQGFRVRDEGVVEFGGQVMRVFFGWVGDVMICNPAVCRCTNRARGDYQKSLTDGFPFAHSKQLVPIEGSDARMFVPGAVTDGIIGIPADVQGPEDVVFQDKKKRQCVVCIAQDCDVCSGK